MSKKRLAKVYSRVSKEAISERNALKEIDIFLETVEEALQKDGSIMFINRGVFEVKERKARKISNPATREIMTIHPKKTVKFRASKNMIK